MGATAKTLARMRAEVNSAIEALNTINGANTGETTLEGAIGSIDKLIQLQDRVIESGKSLIVELESTNSILTKQIEALQGEIVALKSETTIEDAGHPPIGDGEVANV